MKTKQCTKCGAVKNVMEFTPVPKNYDGLYSWCRECAKEYTREYRITHPKIVKIGKDERRARNAVTHALERGRMTKPTVCAYKDNTCYGLLQAHHYNGYKEKHALDVIWLCRSHHTRLHKQGQ